MDLEESTLLTSDYTTKLQSSRQYGTGTKQKQRPMEREESPETNPCTIGTLFLIKEAIIYNWTKIASSVNTAEKTGHLHVNKCNQNTS